ncbi:MAG: hypothetical protein RXR43_11660 [Sulfolobus sp.]
MSKFDEQLIETVKKLIQKNSPYVKIGLSVQEERKLQKIDPDLYKEYIEAKARVEKNRAEFKENVLKTINKINEILSKYNASAVLDMFDENAFNSPGHYCITIKTKRLPREQFVEFVNEVKKLGFKYNSYNWEYCDVIGNYPKLNVKL